METDPDRPGPPDDAGEDPIDGQDPATGLHTTTTPRAMLRPVPEGFPTPPPRPARPNRRPAKVAEEPQPPRRRGVLIAALATVAVLVLTVGIGGSILVYRALSPAEQPPPAADPAGTDAPADEGPGEVVVGEVTVREVSTELGARSVGSSSTQLDAEGEFVILTVEIVNDSEFVAVLTDGVTLETADGQSHSPDREATNAHLASTEPFGIVPEGSSQTMHVIFDVQIGSEPVSATFDLSSNPAAGSGELTLGA